PSLIHVRVAVHLIVLGSCACSASGFTGSLILTRSESAWQSRHLCMYRAGLKC
ncbi:hypothetical protein BD779DRAFT_1516111, partial [Infundibulicybe gibba]